MRLIQIVLSTRETAVDQVPSWFDAYRLNQQTAVVLESLSLFFRVPAPSPFCCSILGVSVCLNGAQEFEGGRRFDDLCKYE